jgi:hypothetical protein
MGERALGAWESGPVGLRASLPAEMTRMMVSRIGVVAGLGLGVVCAGSAGGGALVERAREEIRRTRGWEESLRDILRRLLWLEFGWWTSTLLKALDEFWLGQIFWP